MPKTRSRCREQRLSDFFPSIEAPSPIVPDTATRRRTRSKAASSSATVETPVPKSFSRRTLNKKKRESQSTPTVFDPAIHGLPIETSQDSEDDFVQSITFSAVKPKTPEPPTPSAQSYHDYEVLVDYDSDENGFSFSPLKSTPLCIQKKPLRRSNGTPAPRKMGQVFWNSALKRIESWAEDQPQEALDQDYSSNASSDFGNSSSGSDEDVESAAENLTRVKQVDLTDSTQEPVQIVEKEIDDCAAGIRLPMKPYPFRKSGAQVLQEPQRDSKRNGVVASNGLNSLSRTDTRSPKITLTRAIPGSKSTHMLEQLPIPDYILAPEPSPSCKPARAFQKTARVPEKLKPTIPRPFHLSQPRSQTQDGLQTNQALKPINQRSSKTQRLHTGDDVLAHKQVPSRKRKTSEGDHDAGLSSLAKRVKLTTTGRPLAPLRQAQNVRRQRSTKPTFEFSSEAEWKERASRRESRTKGQGTANASKPKEPQIGLVPRTLYSPEKQSRLTKNNSVTKPAPFKFSTDARASRSPSVPRTTIEKPTKAAPTRKSHIVDVPVLRTAPFIPKPSLHQPTVAASPVRTLPSRIQIRREFDKVADQHATENLRRRKEEEEKLALERERRMEERKGWQDQGKFAIEQWAKAKINSDGRRDWID